MSGDILLALFSPPVTGHALGWADAVLLGAMLATCGIIAAVDARDHIIPDACNLVAVGLGLAFAGLDGRTALLAAVVQGAAAFGVFWGFRALYHGLRGRHGLGLGDVKFLGAAGIWVGLGSLPPLILVACGTALVSLGLARLRGHAITAGLALPFGPFLVIGFLGVLALRLS